MGASERLVYAAKVLVVSTSGRILFRTSGDVASTMVKSGEYVAKPQGGYVRTIVVADGSAAVPATEPKSTRGLRPPLRSLES